MGNVGLHEYIHEEEGDELRQQDALQSALRASSVGDHARAEAILRSLLSLLTRLDPRLSDFLLPAISITECDHRDRSILALTS